MNYPDLIWRLVEMLLEKEHSTPPNAKKQDETT